MLIQAKQINKFMLAALGISGFASAGGTTEPVTSALTTALATASNSGGAIPLQVGSSVLEGPSVAVGLNLVKIYDNVNNRDFMDSLANEVWGELTNAGAVWTIAYFSMVAGVKTAYTMIAATNLKLEFPVWFSFDDLPGTAIFANAERHVAPDPASGSRIQTDAITVTALNTFGPLSQAPVAGAMLINVNGHTFTAIAQVGTITAKQITWVPATAGYNLQTSDVLTVTYTF